MHYLPVDGLYVYFRYDANQTIMCIMNTNDKEMDVDFSKYTERATGFTKANNVLTGETLGTTASFKIQPMSMTVLELKR
jgi:hypothetical protein